MSLEYLKQLITTKYNEIYNVDSNKTDIQLSTEMENFIYMLLEEYDKNEVMYIIKELFDIEFKYIDEDEDEENIQNKICRNDEEFKKTVKDRYKTCIICDNNSECDESVYEVAHILDFSKCETELEKYDVNNGLLMCANMHKRFDKFLLKFVIDGVVDGIINNNYIVKIMFCDSMIDYGFYKKYNDKEIQLNKENIIYIKKKNNSNKTICS
jgi:predicted restriction endonuclease